MKIPLKADALCHGGLYGKTVMVIVHPFRKEVTHVVVEGKYSKKEVIIPVDTISESTDFSIEIDMDMEDLDDCPDFIKHEYIPISEDMPVIQVWTGQYYVPNAYYYSPYVIHKGKRCIDRETQDIPRGELGVKRGMKVYDKSNHKVGVVDELVIDECSDIITHIVLRKGHLWGVREISVPAENLDKINVDGIELNIDKEVILSLPDAEIIREWK